MGATRTIVPDVGTCRRGADVRSERPETPMRGYRAAFGRLRQNPPNRTRKN